MTAMRLLRSFLSWEIDKFKTLLKEEARFYEIKLKQKVNKPKELWKTLKFMGLPSRAASASNICKHHHEAQKQLRATASGC